jgi:hypothetical protein
MCHGLADGTGSGLFGLIDSFDCQADHTVHRSALVGGEPLEHLPLLFCQQHLHAYATPAGFHRIILSPMKTSAPGRNRRRRVGGLPQARPRRSPGLRSACDASRRQWWRQLLRRRLDYGHRSRIRSWRRRASLGLRIRPLRLRFRRQCTAQLGQGVEVPPPVARCRRYDHRPARVRMPQAPVTRAA